MLSVNKYSLGVGDRFAHQAQAQLAAFQKFSTTGTTVIPVWNKSNREHVIIGSEPDSVLAAAEVAVESLDWKGPWHVDADHINLDTVDRFIESSDFFTLDVADSIGLPADSAAVDAFLARHTELSGTLHIDGIDEPLETSPDQIRSIIEKFLCAITEAGEIYRHIAAAKGEDHFITEVSMDETDSPQTPLELLVILAAIADEGIPIQTIAPKFTGRFNKGVEYVGDLTQFEKEFDEDLAVIAHAIQQYGLMGTLKLSVHSGSDKFSIYPIINRLIKKHDAGLHVKTAGTNWLEEVIGLAEAGGEALEIAKDIYAESYAHYDELTAPYATVLDIDRAQLPSPQDVASWDSAKYTDTLRHVQSNADYNLHFRQLVHVGFKVAAKMGGRYTDALKTHKEIIAKNVTENLLDRHLTPIFSADKIQTLQSKKLNYSTNASA